MADYDFEQNVALNKKTLLYVGGLDQQVDEDTLANIFMSFGELQSVTIPQDELSKEHRGRFQ